MKKPAKEPPAAARPPEPEAVARPPRKDALAEATRAAADGRASEEVRRLALEAVRELAEARNALAVPRVAERFQLARKDVEDLLRSMAQEAEHADTVRSDAADQITTRRHVAFAEWVEVVLQRM